jgi:HD domain
MTSFHGTIAGIPIPDSTIAREATELVRDVSTPLLFDHSRRVFLWGSLHGEQLLLDYDPELFYVAAMFHDLGLVEAHRSEHERFEIDGANAAREFLERHGVGEERVTIAWDAIALHTTPEVPRYKQPEVRLVNWGVEYDIPGRHFDELTAGQREAVIAAHPRPDFKAGIIEALAAGIRDKAHTAYLPWQIEVLEATTPGYVRPSFCEAVRRSGFAT